MGWSTIPKIIKAVKPQVKKTLEKSGEDIGKMLTKSGQLLQKVKGEKITKSGISKGKDIK